jgi:hypothetical protein
MKKKLIDDNFTREKIKGCIAEKIDTTMEL